MSTWKETTLGRVISLQRGIDTTQATQTLGSVPVISSSGISSYRADPWTEGPGVIIGRKGTLGRVYYVDEPYWPHDTTLWVTDFRGNDPKFIYYFLKQLDTGSMNVGSASPTLNRNHLYPLPVLIPPRPQQHAIAEVLGALDDKIGTNANLVDSVQQLSKGHFTRHATARARLTDLARFVNGRNFTKEASGTGRVVIRIAELNSGVGGSTVYNEVDVPHDNVAAPGEILFSWSGSLKLKRWMLPEGIVNQHIFKVIPNQGIPEWLAFHSLRTQVAEFKAIAADKATTMGHIQRMHLEVDVPIPSPGAQATMHESMQALWDLELATEQECQTLAQLRDTLLPALMDGRLRVRDAVQQVESML